MGKRGPKTQPVALARMKGTYRPCYYGKPEASGIEYIDRIPGSPPGLNEFGRQVWIGICEQAVKVGNWISWTDLPGLEHYCKAAEIARNYSLGNSIEEDEKGSRRRSAEFKVWRDAVMIMERLGRKFGVESSSKDFVKFGMKDEMVVKDYARWKL